MPITSVLRTPKSFGRAEAVPLLKIRRMRAEDIPSMLRIAAASPEASQWSAGTYDALLHDPGKGEVWVAQSLEDLAGFASFRVIGKEAELLNLAVRPENRRFGYGKILLQQVCDEAARLHAERLFLEVR